MGQPCDIRKLLEEDHAHLRFHNAKLSHEVHGTVAKLPRLTGPCDLEIKTDQSADDTRREFGIGFVTDGISAHQPTEQLHLG